MAAITTLIVGEKVLEGAALLVSSLLAGAETAAVTATVIGGTALIGN